MSTVNEVGLYQEETLSQDKSIYKAASTRNGSLSWSNDF